MTWEYKVSTGVLSHNGEFVANCYSGAGESKDKPECESQRNRGPIPRGIYFIAGWNNHKSAEAIILEPIAGTNTFGRDHFQIHGDKEYAARYCVSRLHHYERPGQAPYNL